jgi:nitrogen fixation protein FixH
MSVDAVMVTLAIRTHSGVVTEEAYEKGLAYNKTLDAARRQAEDGWHHEMTIEGRTLRFRLLDKAGEPVRGADMVVRIKRAVESGHDFEVAMPPSDSEGYYKTVLDVPMAGAWQVRVFATWQSKHYQAGKVFVIR